MQTTWILRWASLLALVLALPGEASAGSSPPLANDEKRELPSYDGRAEEPLTLGEALLWGPRVLLFPAYALTEWGIRAPVGAVARWVEKDRVVERVSRLVSGDASIRDHRQHLFEEQRVALGRAQDPRAGCGRDLDVG